ncbi:MAG: hypothetical protein OXU20_20485 [Myxococcales bacterium]|nr:hypothetical protein [Myxococcales bacterium]
MDNAPENPHEYPSRVEDVVAQLRGQHGIGVMGIVDQLRTECDLDLAAAGSGSMDIAAAELKKLQEANGQPLGDEDADAWVPLTTRLERASRSDRRRWVLLESYCHVITSLHPGHVVDMVRSLDEASRLIGRARVWVNGPSPDFLAWAREVDGRHAPMALTEERRALPESVLRVRSGLRQVQLDVDSVAADIADGILATAQARHAIPKASKPVLVYLQWTLRDGRHRDGDGRWGEPIFTWPEVARLVDDLEQGKTKPEARARDRVRKFRETEFATERARGRSTRRRP